MILQNHKAEMTFLNKECEDIYMTKSFVM
jgi:hypothetical protein